MSIVKTFLAVALFGLSASTMVACAAGVDSGADSATDDQATASATGDVTEDTAEAEQALDNGPGGGGSNLCAGPCAILWNNCKTTGYANCFPWSASCKLTVDQTCNAAYGTCLAQCTIKAPGGGGVAY